MTFAQILGHDRQKEILRRALTTGRLAHAYLFEGPEGVGKQLMALALARAVFCTEGLGCGTCVACRKVDHHNHPDLHLLVPDGATLKIEQVRGLQKELSYKPLEAPKKICLIEAADRMNPAAGNALLKTLEEPNGDALLILLTSRPERLLTTIRSRCQRLPFQRLPQMTIEQVLHRQLGLDETEGHVLAALAEGSFKKALGKNRELYLDQRKQLVQQIVELQGGRVIPVFDLAQKLADDKEHLQEILEILQAVYRDLLLQEHAAPAERLVNIDLRDQIRQLGQRETTASLLRKLSVLARTRYLLERNVNRQLALEVLLLELAA